MAGSPASSSAPLLAGEQHREQVAGLYLRLNGLAEERCGLCGAPENSNHVHFQSSVTVFSLHMVSSQGGDGLGLTIIPYYSLQGVKKMSELFTACSRKKTATENTFNSILLIIFT